MSTQTTPLRVVSLFDGISVAQSAIADFTKDYEYYAYEIEKNALKVAHNNYPKTIFMGGVRHPKPDGQIDLLIGGSPCQGFSMSGRRQGFKHQGSVLFFEYLRTLEKLNPRFYILENVPNPEIERYLGKGVIINSNTFVPQNRERCFWTNIPIKRLYVKGKSCLDDICDFDNFAPNYYKFSDFNRVQEFKKYYKFAVYAADLELGQAQRIYKREFKCGTLTKSCSVKFKILCRDGRIRDIHPIEFERLQGLPDNYTQGLSPNQRGSVLGNAFTKQIIADILDQAPNLF